MKPPLRTAVYVDGFNLYYRALKSSAFKWLDLKTLSSELLGPEYEIEVIRYFTAPIPPASRLPSSPRASPSDEKANPSSALQSGPRPPH